jgi:hypothetical protein
LVELNEYFSNQELVSITTPVAQFDFHGARDEVIKFLKDLSLDLEA